MTAHTVIGSGGTRLYVEETGDPKGQPILFIHGFSQSRLTWRKQFNSSLTEEFRLVALDLRGHGQSDKPRDAYGESQIWAEDIQAVITTLNLQRPVLSGWSYGGVIISDYVRVYGDGQLGGIHLIGALTKLGEALTPLLGQEFAALVPGFFSTDAINSANALQKLVRLITHRPLPPEEFYYTLGYNTIVPPYVREGLLSRSLTNDDVLASLQVPVLITHGDLDEIVLPTAAQEHIALIKHAQVSLQPDIGHAPFWEGSERFNRELADFVNQSVK
jgi:pimeloyl-ACP methyl ester carboxylesterase